MHKNRATTRHAARRHPRARLGARSCRLGRIADANGAMTSDGLRRYEFDAANRLAAMTVGAVDTSPTTRYIHNALGQRRFKTEPQFPPAAGDESDPSFMASLLYELGSGGANSSGSAHYVYLPTPAGPLPIATYLGGRHYAVHTDHLGTPRRLSQSNNLPAWQWAFSAFGNEPPTTGKNRYVDPATSPNAGTTTLPDVTFNLRYPGQYYDKESGLSYNYFRSYDAKTGRYTQSDPIDLRGGWNRFGYVNQNPLKFIDPYGLDGFDLTDASPVPGGEYQPPNPLDNTLTPSPQAMCIAKCMAGKAATGAGIALSGYGLLELGARTGYLSPLAVVGLVSTYRQYGKHYTTGRQALSLEQCKSECDDKQCKK